MSTALRRIALLLALPMVATFGCRGCGGATTTPVASTASTSTPAERKPQPLTAELLAPILRERGVPSELQTQLFIDLAREAAPEGAVGKEAKGTSLVISPPVKGVLTWATESSLAFRPAQPFAYDTKYQVTVDKIETRQGVLAPTTPWAASFQTPRFELVRIGLERLDRGQAEVGIVFSGPVKPEAVAPFVTFEVNGTRLATPRLSNTERGNVVRGTIPVADRSGGTIRVALREGVPAAHGGVKAPVGRGELEIPHGPPVEIKTSHLRQGGNGFYVEVFCDDTAVGGKRYFWDRESNNSYQLSRRCVLSAEAAARAIRFSPPVKFSVAPGAGGFRIFGDFARGALAMTIDAGATTEDGGVLVSSYEETFGVPARSPALGFASGGRYLPRSAWKSLPVTHTNVDQAELRVRQIPPENLVFWLSEENDERATERTSDLLLKKVLPFKGPTDRQATSWIDLAGSLPASTRGVLELTLESGHARASSRLLVTQLNLVAKRSVSTKDRWKQEVWVWALDMDSADTVSGVDVSLVRKSGKVVGQCNTSGDSGCKIQVTRDDADESEPFALVARKGDDLTYIRWADLKTDTSDADVAGDPFGAEAAYRAAVWTERGVYRPGDVAHVAAIVRDQAHQAPPAGMPIELQLIDPREKVARRVVVKTNEAGLVVADIPFAAFADTGRYQVVARVADRRVGAHPFNVEEFVPERMKVQAAVERPSYLHGDPAKVDVGAVYLFGGSAQGASVEVTCSLEPSAFKPGKENLQYTYGPRPGRGNAKPVSLGSAEGTLDKAGHASVSCPPASGAFGGPARLVAQAAVFEGGSGRSTVARASAAVHPERYYVGLQAAVQRAEVNKPIPVKGVVVDWNGALAPAAVREVSVELVRLEPEYGWWWNEEGGGERFERHLRPVSEGATRAAVTDGQFSVNLVPREQGAGYLVRVRSGLALTEVEVAGDSRGYYWDDGASQRREQTPRPLKPTSLVLDLPGSVKVGEQASVKATIPFRGRALLTVETDHVVTAEWRKVEAGETTLHFTVTAFAPNVYVSLLVVKDPHLESDKAFLPDRAFGLASAAVEPVEYTAPMKLEVPSEVRSSSTLTVKLNVGKTEGATFAVVAAVDEGILQLTQMKSPDPQATIFAKRALGVDTFETVGWSLLLPPQGTGKATGGDAGGGAAGRVQPVKPVALWSGLVPVNPDGTAEVKFQVPQYRGQLRVMAVSAGPKRMGRASVSVTVRDPIVLSTTLPRFVTQNDLLQIPVFVTNLSGATQEVKVALAAESLPVPGMAPSPVAAPPLVFVGKSEGSVKLANGAAGTLVFQVRAAVAVGAAKLRVVARAGGFESHEELDVPFLPAGPRERLVKRLEVTDATVDLKPHLEGWVPTSERTTVWLTSNPYGEAFDHLKYLLHYPYGCVEQTTSSSRPLLFVGNLLDQVDPGLVAGGKVEEMVMAGVTRLLSMQTPSGGLAYWPGGTEPHGWGTAYATHFLLDAQKVGYAVPQDRLEEILKWMEGEVGRLERGQGERGWYHGPSTEAYLHYTLALAGRGQKARLQRLVEQLPAGRDGEALERQYMLQAALYLAGDRRYEKELRQPDITPLADERRNNWSFYSDRRRRGFVLSTFQDLFGNDSAGEPLAQRVADGLRQPSSFYNTQEIVWGVTGLGKRIGTTAKDFKPGRLLANGRVIEARPSRTKASDRTWAVARASEYGAFKLEVPDRGAGGKLYVILSSDGVRQQPDQKQGGSGLAVSRTYRLLDGTVVDPRGRETALAGLLFVELVVRNTSGERIQNVSLVDRIPAGFEIENPRLGRGQNIGWIDEESLWKAEFLDVRDHQLAVFGTLERSEARKVVYAVRAVTAGQFTLPPVEAEAMYDPRLWAREAGGVIRVSGPWKDNLL